MKKFYTYIHSTPDGEPFYIGKGSGNRAHDFINRNKNHKLIVEKYGIENIKVFIFDCDSNEQAISDEKQQIFQLRNEQIKLTNVNPILMIKKKSIYKNYNAELAKKARRRRAMYYRLHINKNITATALARRFGISHQRMSYLLRLAKKELPLKMKAR